MMHHVTRQVFSALNVLTVPLYVLFAAGRTTTNEELEDMLESGKLAIFTDDVSTAPEPGSRSGSL